RPYPARRAGAGRREHVSATPPRRLRARVAFGNGTSTRPRPRSARAHDGLRARRSERARGPRRAPRAALVVARPRVPGAPVPGAARIRATQRARARPAPGRVPAGRGHLVVDGRDVTDADRARAPARTA